MSFAGSPVSGGRVGRGGGGGVDASSRSGTLSPIGGTAGSPNATGEMDASALRELLAVMREAGVRRGQFKSPTLEIQVEFDGARASRAAEKAETGAITFRDQETGEPVDLDAGAPETARDVDAEIASKNLKRAEKPSG